MPVSFRSLVVGEKYERPYLAQLWGYSSYQAISRGVVTPRRSKFIILFVTEEKQESLTQYRDYLEGGYLHWEGEAKHGSDERIIRASAVGDEIHLFHRKVHHSPFRYMGRVQLEQHNLLKDAPSQFIFALPNAVPEQPADHDSLPDFGIKEILETERNAILKARIGQGVFRDGLLRLWGSCAVTGYKRPSLLLASHIKPWKVSTNKERLDPYNGLLLQPTLDRLFDKALISFDSKGKLIWAPTLNTGELRCLGISPDARLRMVPKRTMPYLEWHRDVRLGQEE